MAGTSASGGLVERERELAVFGAVFEAGASGHGGVVLVEGHGGMGKTRLLDAAADDAEARGAEVLRARGHDLEREFAFGVALQLVQRRVLRAPEEEAAAVLAGAAALAAPLLRGEVAASAPGRAQRAEPAPSADALQHGLFWLVSNLADRGPVVLWVDDAHLADSPSLRFLLYLAQRVEDLAVTVCLAARPGEAGDAEELLARLRSHPAATVLALEPLSRQAVGSVVADQGFAGADPEFVRACAEATAGNPFYLLELLRVLRDEGSAADAARVAEVGPSAVAHAVWLALSRLPAEATAFARAAAVLGDGARPETVARLAALDEPAATGASDALADAGLLRPGDDVRFVHAIVRAAIYDDLRPAERAAAHEAAARLLAADHEEAAPHLLATGVLAEEWAADVLRGAAARTAAARDPASAARFLRRLLREPLDGRQRSEALVELAQAEAATGAGDATARLEEALELVEDADARARVLLLLGRILHQAGRFPDAEDAFRRGLDAQPREEALVADLRSGWANAAMWNPEHGGAALMEATRAVASIASPRTVGELAALANLAGAMTLRGENREEAVAIARRAWAGGALLREAGPQEPAFFAVAPTLGWADELDEAYEIYDSVATEARRRGLVIPYATATYGVGGTHFYAGRLPEAIAALESALDASRYGWGQFKTGALWMLTRCLLDSGRVDAAERLLDLPTEEEARMSATPDFMAVHSARAYVLLARSEHERVLEESAAARRWAHAMGATSPAFFPWRRAEIQALVALGRRAEAVEHADDQLARSRVWGAASIVGWSLVDRAFAEEDLGRRVGLLREAAEVLARSPARVHEAHALLDLGAALREAGDLPAARDALRAALDLADRCSAHGVGARAREELVAAGARPRRARTTGAAALTPAELRVTRMAAAGRTNREIAEDLFVTVKAVKFHLGNAYRKLGVSERSRLAEALEL
jgi:DNA-binding CsgD family transcriptional regulator